MLSQEKIWNEEYGKHRIKWAKDTKTLPLLLKNKIVLELGLGNGKTLRSIIKQKPKEVIALDFSLEALKQVKKEFPSAYLVNSDVTNMPFPDNQFDVVVCYYILNNLSEKERKQAVKEIHRVLKPKGKVLFEDFAVGDFREFGTLVSKHTIRKKNGIICHFFTVKELSTLFSSFSMINLKEKSSFPIKHKKLKRKIISGIIEKKDL